MNIKRPIVHIGIFTLIIIAIVLICMLVNSAAVAIQSSSLDDFYEHLNIRIPKLMKAYHIPGVNIALVQKGEVSWSKEYGYADLEQKRKMTTNTMCRAQSISKPITAWGVMRLVEQGKISLDDPVYQYLNNWSFPKSEFSAQNITIRHLLSHTAGLQLGTVGVHYSPLGDVPSLKDNLTKEAHLIQDPGTSFIYSNVGFNLLELLIEEVTGQEFSEYIEEEVLNPLGMHSSDFTWSENINPEIPVGYDLKGQSVPVYIYPEKASGGLFTTVEDLARFIRAGSTFSLTDHEVLSANSISNLYTPTVKSAGQYSIVSDSYGLGYFIESLPNGQQAVFHGGQGHGWMTHLHFIPETGDGIVILTNSQRSWPFISSILTDWAKWCGFDSIGMSMITKGVKISWCLIGLIILFSLTQMWSLGKDLYAGNRKFAPLSNISCALRLLQSSLGFFIMAVLLWCMSRDYTFLSAIFPLAYNWLGFAVFLLAIALLTRSFFPHNKLK